MANHASAVKRARQNEKRRARNQVQKSAVRTVVKKVRNALEAKNVKEAEASLPEAIVALSRGVSKNLFHKSNAARRISRLQSQVNRLKKSASAS